MFRLIWTVYDEVYNDQNIFSSNPLSIDRQIIAIRVITNSLMSISSLDNFNFGYESVW
jgi:hypothetical protein